MIHVCYGLYDKDGKYSKFCGTSIASIFENTSKKVTIHILHDNTLTKDNRDKFNYLANQYHQKIKFYNVEIAAVNEIEMFKTIMLNSVKNIFTSASIYRFLIVKLLPLCIDKIIYFDAGDTLIHCDIGELWNIDIKDYPCAAVPEVLNGATLDKFLPMVINGTINRDNYFNSGVMVLNLNYLRGGGVFQH